VEFASGDVGLNFQIFAGANPTVRSGAAKGVAILSIFTPNVGSTASFANSTPLFDSLSYQGVNDGTVNLAPQIVKGVDGTLLSYWTNSSIGSGTAVSTYTTSNFGAQASDSIVPLPTLAVNIVGTLPPPPTHPIIALTLASPGSNYAGSGLIPVTITDNEGVYTIKQMVLKTSRATNTFEVNGLIPSPQTEELFAFDMNLDSDQLATLAADINSTNAYGFGSAIASTSLANDPFSGLFNLFLTFSDSQLPPGTTGTDYLGFDFTQDPNVSGAEPFQVAVTAVPEPMTFGAFVLGTVGSLLLRRRSRASPISSPG
jgi:hypothetical protein